MWSDVIGIMFEDGSNAVRVSQEEIDRLTGKG